MFACLSLSLLVDCIKRLNQQKEAMGAKEKELESDGEIDLGGAAEGVCSGSDADSENDSKDYRMPCCSALWQEGIQAVECSGCAEYFHLKELGSCPGAGISQRTASQKKFRFFCCFCKQKQS